MMLRDSRDPEIRIDPPEIKTARKWVAEVETDNIIAELRNQDVVGAVQTDRKGLGSNRFKPFSAMNARERREAVSERLKKNEADKREVHLIQCAQQGQVKRWDENV